MPLGVFLYFFTLPFGRFFTLNSYLWMNTKFTLHYQRFSIRFFTLMNTTDMVSWIQLKAAPLLGLKQLQRVAWCVYPRKPSARDAFFFEFELMTSLAILVILALKISRSVTCGWRLKKPKKRQRLLTLPCITQTKF